MAKEYIRVKISALLETVIYADLDDMDDEVDRKIDCGDFEVKSYEIDDINILEDHTKEDILREKL